MQVVKVGSLREFIAEHSSHFDEPGDRPNHDHYSKILFRGQSDASWKLTTTLERFSDREFTIHAYHRLLQQIQHKFSAHTGSTLTAGKSNDGVAEAWQEVTGGLVPHLLEFMIYLRHCGFPSPLLDWTASPYIASYFAYRDASLTSEVAIYAYQEYVGDAKALMGWGACYSRNLAIYKGPPETPYSASKLHDMRVLP